MKKKINLKNILKNEAIFDKVFMTITGASLLINISLWLLFYYRITPSEYPIPLHYNIYTGIDMIDDWYKIFVIPSFGLLMLIINTIIGVMWYKRDKFLSYLLYVGALVLQAVILTGGVVITIGL